MSDLTSKAEVLETYAELFDMFDDSKEICKELCKVYDKIMGLPTIDAVLVVRCKDCQSFHECIDGLLVCRNEHGLNLPKETDFCPYGKRREDETN